MENKLQCNGGSKKTRKRLRKTKPYRNDELSSLWKNMHDKEKLFLKTNNKHRRQFYSADFLTAHKTFDKCLRHFE